MPGYPDDPLITWLRDGHLGGITLGSSREDVLEQWGEPVHPQGRHAMVYCRDHLTNRPCIVLGFGLEGLRHLETVFDETPGFHLPPPVGAPPYLLGQFTDIDYFLEVTAAHRIDVSWNQFYTQPSAALTGFVTRSGVNVIFRQRLLYRLIMIPSLALWNYLVLN